jgi:hypothetical protein
MCEMFVHFKSMWMRAKLGDSIRTLNANRPMWQVYPEFSEFCLDFIESKGSLLLQHQSKGPFCDDRMDSRESSASLLVHDLIAQH